MQHISEVLNQSKVSFRDFQAFVAKNQLSEFLRHFKYLFLVGKDLIPGVFEEYSSKGPYQTVKFSKQTLENPVTNTSYLNKNMYVFYKDGAKHEATFYLTVGRSSKHDITIADYTISRDHAKISNKNGTFLLEDLGATNGLKHNGTKIPKNDTKEIRPLDVIQFGRFEFILLSPIDVFVSTHQTYGGKRTLAQELKSAMNNHSADELYFMASRIGYPMENLDRRKIITQLTNYFTPQLLLKELYHRKYNI